jgi:uncharacterized protein (DUF342 family)
MGYKLEVKLTKDRMAAELYLYEQEKGTPVSMDDLTGILKEHKVIFGVKTEVLEAISTEPQCVNYPIVVAEGRKQINGTDAYLRNELTEIANGDSKNFNFRNVMHIKSVTSDQLLATAIPPTAGVNGIDVTGMTLAAKPGRPLSVKAGKNVLLKSDQFYSVLDGQLSITNRSISVNPVFQVNGDLDLSTGNINFVGNISIKGNVPSGYELIAGGDIRVSGLVEAATLQAAGNIIVEGGVAGGMKGSITAGGTIQANYLSQAIVKAGQDLIVKSSILHSKVSTGNNIDCRTGTIIGGALSAGRNIHVRDLGNELFTKTELAIGWDPALEKSEKEINESIETANATIKKLNEIENKLMDLVKTTGKLTAEQQQVILKQRATRKIVENQVLQSMDELAKLQAEKQDRLDSSLYVYEKVFPNSKVYFGKYAFVTNNIHKKVSMVLDNSEIRIQHINDPEKVH